MTDNTFLGRKITGDVSHRYVRRIVEQHDPQEFLDAIDAALSVPGVEAVRWEQYTPYFNDGDPCYFSTRELRAQIEGLEGEDTDYGDGFYCGYELSDWGPGATYDERMANAIYEVDGVNTEAAYRALSDIGSIIDHHQSILQQKFGDPALITATKDGFDVDFYEHD